MTDEHTKALSVIDDLPLHTARDALRKSISENAVLIAQRDEARREAYVWSQAALKRANADNTPPHIKEAADAECRSIVAYIRWGIKDGTDMPHQQRAALKYLSDRIERGDHRRHAF